MRLEPRSLYAIERLKTNKPFIIESELNQCDEGAEKGGITTARAEASKALSSRPAALALEYMGATGSADAKADRTGSPTW